MKKIQLQSLCVFFFLLFCFAGIWSATGQTGRDNKIDTTTVINEEQIRNYLRSIIPSEESIATFLAGKQGPEQLSRHEGWKYDAELGWVHCDVVRNNSVDGSRGFYHYESDGARRVVNSPDVPCRIHTYGNSFTHCDQVSDGETWQEFLASHLQEPVRNYGVGGYGVYQAYRRMLKVEKENSAEYIILNIWSDDHFRSLDAWRSIRFGQGSNCGFTLPHLRIDVQNNLCEQVENLLTKPEDVYKLRDEDFLWDAFRDDPVLKLVLTAQLGGEVSDKLVRPVAVTFGIPDEKTTGTTDAKKIREIHTKAALYASQNIITWTEQFVKENGKKLMIILSFDRGNIARELNGAPRFDQSFVDWMKDKPYPVIDMRDYFREDFSSYKGTVKAYLDRYYIGHHTPAGNFLFAWALKDRIVEWLEPAPAPYQ
ncbi:hypothetical protein ACFL47_00940 [Candidatus Latescibacterota bacterium]